MDETRPYSAEEKKLKLGLHILEPIDENSVIAAYASWIASDRQVNDPEALRMKTMALGQYMSNLYGISLQEAGYEIDKAIISATHEQQETHAD